MLVDRAKSLAKLESFNHAIGAGDVELAEETADYTETVLTQEVAPGPAQLDFAIDRESIILRRQRPVLKVIGDTTELDFMDQLDSATWKSRLRAAKDQLDAAILAVGRINLVGGPLDWVGTGWLVDKDVIVTNRHVAETFAERSGSGLRMITGGLGAERAEIDFLEEYERRDRKEFKILRPLFIAPRTGPDLAFFEVEHVNGDHRLAQPIALCPQPRLSGAVATIGYPAFDSRIPDLALMEEIYGSEYNVKRLAPGAVTAIEETRLLHNCTTLGGNSGSAVIDLESGEALALHFGGAFLSANFAVRSDTIKAALDQTRRGETTSARPAPAETAAQDRRLASPAPSPVVQAPPPASAAPQPNATSATLTIPLSVSVTISAGTPIAGTSSAPPPPVISPNPPGAVGDVDSDIEEELEARPEDYLDRQGYQIDFIGRSGALECPLPTVERDPADMLRFNFAGQNATELKYQHFSVVMSRSRRLCLFSAVNIDGARPGRAKRARWRFDPRIPRSQQIMRECYGNPPRFSRGHMTRRQDPSWGASALARRGNQDSMHVTNAAPQMQAFNSPIWLELEDYALENAIEDDMRISVFTGPIFKPTDPVFYGVKVPVAFWKIIAFVHDDTGHLCATGYRMDQSQSLPRTDEFVFGDFSSTHTGLAAQVSIRSIETESGLRFGALTHLDPLGAEESSRGGRAVAPLLSPRQIRYF